jgi:signal transduction histidine kinase
VTYPGEAPDRRGDATARLRHELKTPLTTILARSQLVARWTARSPTLAEEERARVLASLAAIDAAVAQVLAVIEGMDAGPADGSGRAP